MIDLIDYFAARAPVEPWPWFEPIMPPKPVAPPLEPVAFVESLSPADRSLAISWRQDPCFDLEVPHLQEWAHAWIEYRRAKAHHSDQWMRERNLQWPYFYASQMIEQRNLHFQRTRG